MLRNPKMDELHKMMKAYQTSIQTLGTLLLEFICAAEKNSHLYRQDQDVSLINIIIVMLYIHMYIFIHTYRCIIC